MSNPPNKSTNTSTPTDLTNTDMAKATEPQASTPTPTEPKEEGHKILGIGIGMIILILIGIVILLLIYISRHPTPPPPPTDGTDTSTDGSNGSTDGSDNGSTDSSNETTDGSTDGSDPAETLTAQETTYRSQRITKDGKSYIPFEICDSTNSFCTTYVLDDARLGSYPIMVTANEGMKFVLYGTADQVAINGGTTYYLLNDDAQILVKTEYLAKEADEDDSTKFNYVFKSCANPEPLCINYLMPESITSTTPFVATLTEGTDVGLYGNVTDEGEAAGVHSYKFVNYYIEVLY